MSATTNLKVLSLRDDRYVEGHRLCAGCAEPIIARQVLMATDDIVVAAEAANRQEMLAKIWNVKFDMLVASYTWKQFC